MLKNWVLKKWKISSISRLSREYRMHHQAETKDEENKSLRAAGMIFSFLSFYIRSDIITKWKFFASLFHSHTATREKKDEKISSIFNLHRWLDRLDDDIKDESASLLPLDLESSKEGENCSNSFDSDSRKIKIYSIFRCLILSFTRPIDEIGTSRIRALKFSTFFLLSSSTIESIFFLSNDGSLKAKVRKVNFVILKFSFHSQLDLIVSNSHSTSA